MCQRKTNLKIDGLIRQPAGNFRPAFSLLLTDSGQLWVGGAEDYGYGLARLLPSSAPAITSQPVNHGAAHQDVRQGRAFPEHGVAFHWIVS